MIPITLDILFAMDNGTMFIPLQITLYKNSKKFCFDILYFV